MHDGNVARSSGAFIVAVLLVYGIALAVSRFLHLPMYGDELHFWPSTQTMFQDGFPGAARLRDYSELNTPLPFVIFGIADRLSGGGFIAARAVNFVVSFAIVLTIGFCGGFSRSAALSVAGLLLFPYFMVTSVYMYTDVIAVFFAVSGVVFALYGRNWLACVCFVLGIASRQYIVAFPMALLAALCLEAIATQRLSALAWRSIPYVLAVLSMAGWYAFFGDAAPKNALAGQAIKAGRLYPDHGLYFLTTVGAFFVVIEACLFRQIRVKADPVRLALAIVVIGGFVVFPPAENVNTITDTMGYLDRTLRLVLSQNLRLMAFCVLAVLTCLRFDPYSMAGLMVYANAVLMVVAHVGWDKYAMPLLAVLWLMQSMNALNIKSPNARLN